MVGLALVVLGSRLPLLVVVVVLQGLTWQYLLLFGRLFGSQFSSFVIFQLG